MTLIRLIAFCAVLIPCVGRADEAKRDTLMVAPLQGKGVAAEVAKVFEGRLRVALHQSAVFTLVSVEDSAAATAELERRMEQGCDDLECLEAFGATLSAKFLVTSSLGRVGETTTLTAKLVEVSSLQLRRAATRTIKGMPEDLLPLIPGLAAELAGLKGGLPVARENALLLLPFAGPKTTTDAQQRLLDADLEKAAVQSSRFEKVIKPADLLAKLDAMQKAGIGACAEPACLQAMGAKVGASHVARADVEAVEQRYLVRVRLVEVESGRQMGLETQTVPDHDSISLGLRSVMGSAILRSFEPSAPALHQVMQVSVVAGADPERRRKRAMVFRYGGLGLAGAGVGLAAYGFGGASAAEAAKIAPDANGRPPVGQDLDDLEKERASAALLGWSGLGLAVTGSVLAGMSFLQ